MLYTPMGTSVLGEINRLRQMSVAELRQEWERVYGEPARSSHKDFLFRRLAWEVQARAHGGLSDAAMTRLDEHGEDAWNHATSRRLRAHDAEPATPARPEPKVTRICDARQLTPGTVLTRQYHGHEIRVVALEDGEFEYEGRVLTSLSAVARAVTGAKWNGRLFFGLTERKRRR
jgi:hypothetical protein